MRIEVLGARGSMPVTDPAMRLFGGDTSCYRVEAAGQTVLLDAGSGLDRWTEPPAGPDSAPVPVLLSHPHADHLIGLPMWRGLFLPGLKLRIYGAARQGRSVRQQLEQLIAPPLWPVRPEDYPADICCLELPPVLKAGGLTVTHMEGCHPGGCTVFRLEAEGKALVYATDFEHEPEKEKELTAFARGADLLLYDGMYTAEEYAARKGYGHSTAEAGLRIQRNAGVRSLLLIHHGFLRTDEMLLEDEKSRGVRYARQGEVLTL